MGLKPLLLNFLSLAEVPGFKEWISIPPGAGERHPTKEEFLERNAKALQNLPHSQSLDLGYGNNPRNPFLATTSKRVGINPSEDERIITRNLRRSPIPCEANSFGFVTAYNVFEHNQSVPPNNRAAKCSFID